MSGATTQFLRRFGGTKPPSTKSLQVSIAAGRHRLLRFFLVALFALSTAAACIENGLHPLVLVVVPLVTAALFRRNFAQPYIGTERELTILFFAYMALILPALIASEGRLNLPVFMAYFAFGLLVVRVLAPLTDRNTYQFMFLTLGLVLINCILTNHVIFAIILPFYFFAFLAALVTFHLAKHEALSGRFPQVEERDSVPLSWLGNIGVYVAFMLFLALILFPILPRPFIVFPGLRAGTPLGGGAGLASLAQRISYGEMVSMAGRNRIAFYVQFYDGPKAENPYWRGRVLAEFDGKSWLPGSLTKLTLGLLKQPSGDERLFYKMYPYRLRSNNVYVYGLPVTVLGFQGRDLLVNSQGEVRVISPFAVADSYEVLAAARPLPVRLPLDSVYLDKTGLTAEIEKLARQWAGNAASPKDKAETLMRRFQRDFRYRLRTAPPPVDSHPLEHFLLKTRAGHCEYFAGAMALMLRALDIPSRVVEGFNGMERTAEPDEFIVRFSKAHAWVEAVLDGQHWTTLDPTPPGRDEPAINTLMAKLTDLLDRLEFMWVRTVVNFDRSDQLRLMQKFSGVMSGEIPLSKAVRLDGLTVVVLGIAGVAFLWMMRSVIRRRNGRRSDLASVYVKTMKFLVRRGILPEVHSWHEKNVAEILQKAPYATHALNKFVSLYMEARFRSGTRKAPAALADARRELLQTVKTQHL